MQVYFDNAATTPVAPSVLEAMLPFWKGQFGNPSSTHAAGRAARAAVEQARKQLAKRFSADTGEFYFTSGGTEANNTVIKGAVERLGVGRIISSPTEHDCVLNAVKSTAKSVELCWIEVDEAGRVDLEQLEALLAAEKAPKTLVSLMQANNEVGTLLDLQRVAELCQAHEAYLHSDTVQTVGHFPIDLSQIPVDFISGSAHKLHGPKGSGFLFVRRGRPLQPLIHGGGQERELRSGTENVAGIVGLVTAIEEAYTELDARRAHIEQLRRRLKEGLAVQVPGIRFNGDQEAYLYTLLNAQFPASAQAGLLLFQLDMAGIQVSAGSACSAGALEGSHVLRAMGRHQADRPSIRFSFSHFNTEAEVDYVLEKIGEILG